MNKEVRTVKKSLKGEITIPSDKSIAHRAVMLASLAKGKSIIKNFSKGKDPLSTLKAFQILGIETKFEGGNLVIQSNEKLIPPERIIDCGNSGTTIRLLSGILSGQNFTSILTGDESLCRRPMKRIIEPLTLMGAEIKSNNNNAPLEIKGHELNGITYHSKLSSAQVKSSVLLAGIQANGTTIYTEPFISRNHTELMLSYMNANIKTEGNIISVEKSVLTPKTIEIPGDISSAAYFIAAGLIVPNSKIILKNVGLNPTRIGIIEILTQMGANIEILNKETISNEIRGDIKVAYSDLKACEIYGEMIPKLIDEIPILAVIATQAEGTNVIKDAADLRNKESDRIKSVITELKKLGANIEETTDGMIIHGKTKLLGNTSVESYNDHRLAMSLYVAGLVCEKEIQINNFEWVDISFPEFAELFNNLLT